MPWFFAAKQALTVAVSAPLPPHSDRPPSLAHVARPGNEGRYGPVGERSGWGETPDLSRGEIHHAWEAQAHLWHDVHISWQPVRRWLSVVPAILKGDSDHDAEAGSGINSDDLPRVEVHCEC